jgi:hypothetical protein
VKVKSVHLYFSKAARLRHHAVSAGNQVVKRIGTRAKCGTLPINILSASLKINKNGSVVNNDRDVVATVPVAPLTTLAVH